MCTGGSEEEQREGHADTPLPTGDMRPHWPLAQDIVSPPEDTGRVTAMPSRGLWGNGMGYCGCGRWGMTGNHVALVYLVSPQKIRGH